MKGIKKMMGVRDFYKKRPELDFKITKFEFGDFKKSIEMLPEYIEQFVYIMSHPRAGTKDILYLNKLMEPLTWDQNHLDRAKLGPDLVSLLTETLTGKQFY